MMVLVTAVMMVMLRMMILVVITTMVMVILDHITCTSLESRDAKTFKSSS